MNDYTPAKADITLHGTFHVESMWSLRAEERRDVPCWCAIGANHTHAD